MPSSKHAKCWILTPSQEYEPGKTLSLGQILSNAYDPQSALLPKGPLAIPEDLNSTRDHIKQSGLEIQSSDKLATSLAVWVRANGLPVTAAAGAQQASQHMAAWRLASLESDIFIPSRDYVKQALELPEVRAETQWWRLRRKIFMVTGIRIARGAGLVRREDDKSGFNMEVSVDGSALNIPVSAGVEVGHQRAVSDVHIANRIDDFVFAYRLSEITYRLRVSKKTFTRGEMAAVGAARPQPPQQHDIEEYEVKGIELREPFEGFGWDDEPTLVE